MRCLIEAFDLGFADLHSRSVEFSGSVPFGRFFQRPDGTVTGKRSRSCGEYLLLSASSVERTFLGLMTRAWDDAIEWTLPENFGSADQIIEYLNEVESSRSRAMKCFGSDTELFRLVPAPFEEKPIITILLRTIANAEHLLGKAICIYESGIADRLDAR